MELQLIGIAVLLFCGLSTVRGFMSTLTMVPLVGQLLQILGLLYLVELAWRKWRPDVENRVTTKLQSINQSISSIVDKVA